MSRKKAKYASLFAPAHRKFRGGKVQPPAKQEAEQTGGCGDPECIVCNLDIMGEGGTRTGRTSSRGGTVGIGVEIGDTPFTPGRGSLLSNRIQTVWTASSMGGGPADGSTAARQDRALSKAREAVDAYLVKAPEQAFSDIVGNDEALAQLRDVITAPVHHKELYAAYGMKTPKGALLSGPPGCGKTMFARAAASEMRKLYPKATEFIAISGSELQSTYVGETESRIKAIFTYARLYREHHGHPLLVFMDEADALLPDRTGRVRRLASWEENQVSTFLAEMDGVQESGAFVLLATNRPEVIDQAVLRDGRCDFKIEIKRPKRDAVEVILRNNFEGVLVRENTTEELVFAAVETIFSPHYVIMETQAVGMGKKGKVLDFAGKDFCLEHVVSGAMAASIPNRAVRNAFARDKAAGTASGVTVEDVVNAVGTLFEESKQAVHADAFNEFCEQFATEAEKKRKKKRLN